MAWTKEQFAEIAALRITVQQLISTLDSHPSLSGVAQHVKESAFRLAAIMDGPQYAEAVGPDLPELVHKELENVFGGIYTGPTPGVE